MKKTWKTSEFWAALISSIVGLVVLTGGLNADTGNEIAAALQTIAGAVITLLTALGYMGTRVAIKKARCSVIENGVWIGKDEGGVEVHQRRHQITLDSLSHAGV